MNLLGIDNLFFEVSDLQKAHQFYQQIGFKKKFEIPQLNAILYSIGKEEPGLIICEKKNPVPSKLWIEVESALVVKDHCSAIGIHGKEIETFTGVTFETVDESGNTIGFADYSKKTELARNTSELLFQILRKEDLEEVIKTFIFPWSSYQATSEKWIRYLTEQQENFRIVCMAKVNDQFVGYGSLLKTSEYPEFRDKVIPEIHDLWITQEHRGKGFGKRLLQYLEDIALREEYKQIGLGVGLYKDYGTAQMLYVQQGYVPDGLGITYKYQAVVPGTSYPVDDDLIIWLKKELS